MDQKQFISHVLSMFIKENKAFILMKEGHALFTTVFIKPLSKQKI